MLPYSWRCMATAFLWGTSRERCAMTGTTSSIIPVCTAQSEPNPIASMYPESVTGTINETIVVLPIRYELARSLVPSTYKMLSGYKSLIPELDGDLYPLVMETVFDHDIQVQAFGFSLPDFSSIRFSFPFVDRLGDGYSNFRYSPVIYLAPDPTTVGGAEAIGQKAVLSSFDPPCAGYAFDADKKKKHGSSDKHDQDSSRIYFDTYSATDTQQESALISAIFHTLKHGTSPYPLSFFKNVTNQPIFANGPSCDNMIRYFNTSVTTGPGNSPVPIKGRVALSDEALLPAKTRFVDVFGYKADTAFVEIMPVECTSLKGYGGGG